MQRGGGPPCAAVGGGERRALTCSSVKSPSRMRASSSSPAWCGCLRQLNHAARSCSRPRASSAGTIIKRSSCVSCATSPLASKCGTPGKEEGGGPASSRK
eukprot:5386117-Prymnesium_polylepis.1